MRVILACKNFAAHCNVSHIGLAVTAINTAKSLESIGVMTDVWTILDGNDLRMRLNLAKNDPHPITHVCVSAPFIPVAGFRQLCTLFPRIQFSCTSHSNVGFLQADSAGVVNLRAYMGLEADSKNFHLAGNAEIFCEAITRAYGFPCTWLPNIYFLQGELEQPPRPLWNGGVLKIGIFGATRLLKNFPTGVWASIEIARALKAQTEIWVNVGRDGSGPDAVVLRAARAMVANLADVKLCDVPWCTWPEFRSVVGSMHLLVQPSYTETFNMVTADGVQQGVPSVVSNAIYWAPKHWKAEVDDANDMARIGISLLKDHHARHEGLIALRKFSKLGLEAWKHYLGL